MQSEIDRLFEHRKVFVKAATSGLSVAQLAADFNVSKAAVRYARYVLI